MLGPLCLVWYGWSWNGQCGWELDGIGGMGVWLGIGGYGWSGGYGLGWDWCIISTNITPIHNRCSIHILQFPSISSSQLNHSLLITINIILIKVGYKRRLIYITHLNSEYVQRGKVCLKQGGTVCTLYQLWNWNLPTRITDQKKQKFWKFKTIYQHFSESG